MLPASIAASDSLALAFPTDIAVTATLRQFMNQLTMKGFIVDVALTDDVPGSSLLLVAPRALSLPG